MLYVMTSNLKTGRWADFQEWYTNDGKALITKSGPEGWKLRGVYLTAFNLGDAHVEVHWDVENYSAFDSAKAAARERAGWAEALERLHSFLDPTSTKARLLADAHEGVIVGC